MSPSNHIRIEKRVAGCEGAKFWADGRQTFPWNYFPLAHHPPIVQEIDPTRPAMATWAVQNAKTCPGQEQSRKDAQN
jgi:hypothetical protein